MSEKEIRSINGMPLKDAKSRQNLEDYKKEVNAQIKDIKKKHFKISVKDYGAKGDGVSDDTQAIKECFNYCTENGATMYFPNGTYILNEKLIKSTNPITDLENALKPIYIIGESAFGVKINTTNNTKPVIDVSCSRTVYMSNIASDNTWFHCVQYGDEFQNFSKVRDVQLYNVVSLCKTESFPSWNMFINTPAPNNYNNEEVDSRYNRYPIEIVSNSGYNPIMINNFANKNEDGSATYPSDNSSIGIIDRVINASGVILIDVTQRSAFQVQSRQESVSGIRQNVTYEVGADGSIASGCSMMSNDPNAPGTACLKLRRKYPSIKMYDHNRNNRQSGILIGDDLTRFVSMNESGNIVGGIECDYKKKTTKIIGSLVSGNLKSITDEDFVRVPYTSGVSILKVNISSANWLDGLNDYVTGREICIVSTNNNLKIKHSTAVYGFRTKTGQDIVLTTNQPVKFVYIENGWYQI